MRLDEIEVNYIDKRPGDVMRHRGDGSKAAVELGWKPMMNMEDGLSEIKFHDKIAALEKLGRHLGVFEKDNKQKSDITVKRIGFESDI